MVALAPGQGKVVEHRKRVFEKMHYVLVIVPQVLPVSSVSWTQDMAFVITYPGSCRKLRLGKVAGASN